MDTNSMLFWELAFLLPMVGWAWVVPVITGLASAYGAKKQSKAAKEAAKGGEVKPWGETGRYMDQLLRDSMGAWNTGSFQFGPSPDLLNAYLGHGSKNLGLDLGGFQFGQPTGYGLGAYQQMMNLMQGPAFGGATTTNPAAMQGVQDPWMAGLMGALGGYMASGGTFGR